MDNNNLEGQNDQASGQETVNPDFTLNQAGVSPENISQPMQNNQAGVGQPMQNNQAGIGQPMQNYQSGIGQPMNDGMYNSQFDMGAQGGYNQQGINPQMNYQQPGMPMGAGGSGGSGKPPKVKKPMTKGKITAIIAGSVAFIALIICGVIFLPKILKPAKDVVIDAFENTFTADKESNNNYFDDILGRDDLAELYYEKGGEKSGVFTLNNIVGNEDFAGLSFSSVIKYDPINKLINGTISGDYKDSNFLTVNMIENENTTYMQFLDLIEGYFSVPVQTLGYSEGADIYSGYVDAVEGLWDSVDVEKQGKAKISVNGNNITAKEYYVTIAEEDIEEAITSTFDGVYQAMLADPAILAEAGMDEETLNLYIDQIKTMVPSLISGDLVIKVYIDDKKVVKIVSADTMSLYGVSLGYDFYLDMDDNNVSGAFKCSVMDEEVGVKFEAKDIHGNANGTITVYMPGEAVDINFNTTISETDSSYKINSELSAAYNGSEVATATYSYDYIKSDNTFSGQLICNIVDLGTIEAPFSGGLKDITKGKSITVYFDSIDVSIDGESILNVSYEEKISAGSVSATDYDSSLPVYDLMTITDSDYENIMLDNADNLVNWLDNLYNNTGAFGETIESLFELNDSEMGSDSGLDVGANPETFSDEDMVLKDGNSEVMILGSIDGFTIDYACAYFIDYLSENESMIEYTLESDTSIEEIMGYFNMPSDDTEIYAEEENKTISVDGEDITYSMVQYDSYGYKVSMYRMARQIDDGTYLIIDSLVNDDLDSYSVDQIAAALGNQYYSIVN